MNRHWCVVEDTFWIRGRGQVVVASPSYGFQAKVGWPITLFGPNGAVITTHVIGVETASTLLAVENTTRCYGLLLAGFSEKMKMDGWLAVLYES